MRPTQPNSKPQPAAVQTNRLKHLISSSAEVKTQAPLVSSNVASEFVFLVLNMIYLIKRIKTFV